MAIYLAILSKLFFIMINLIYAQSKNGYIGMNGKLPWHIPADLKYFSKTTKGSVVVMGKKTWLSIDDNHKPLKNRLNIVVTRNIKWLEKQEGTIDFNIESFKRENYVDDTGTGLITTSNLEDLFKFYLWSKEVAWVIGGQEIYTHATRYANEIHVTHVDTEVLGDTKAPVLTEHDWSLKSNTIINKNNDTPYNLNISVYGKN